MPNLVVKKWCSLFIRGLNCQFGFRLGGCEMILWYLLCWFAWSQRGSHTKVPLALAMDHLFKSHHPLYLGQWRWDQWTSLNLCRFSPKVLGRSLQSIKALMVKSFKENKHRWSGQKNAVSTNNWIAFRWGKLVETNQKKIEGTLLIYC